jgi:hypothetical protein
MTRAGAGGRVHCREGDRQVAGLAGASFGESRSCARWLGAEARTGWTAAYVDLAVRRQRHNSAPCGVRPSIGEDSVRAGDRVVATGRRAPIGGLTIAFVAERASKGSAALKRTERRRPTDNFLFL